MHGKGCFFKDQKHLLVTTDASLKGWGAHCQSLVAQGKWSRTELRQSINWLELACLALREFKEQIAGHHVLLLTDNVATKVHVN